MGLSALRSWQGSRWFALVDLGAALAGAVIWYGWPQSGGWPLLIVLLPWGLRLAAGKFPFRRSFLDLPLAIFLLTAAVGVWAAYDQEAAWTKFWLILAGIRLFYALAGQPKVNLKWVMAGTATFACFLAIYFLLAYDWLAEPVKIGLANRMGLRWMALRPELPVPAPDADIIAGILVILAPLFVAAGLQAWRRAGESKRSILAGRRATILAASGLLIVMMALFLAAERGPWLGLIAAAGVWLWWETSRISVILASGQTRISRPELAETSHNKLTSLRAKVFVGGLGLGGVLAGLLLLIYPGGIVALESILPGPAQAANRMQLWQGALKLVEDFPFTGGGLEAFEGLYSHYILVIPHAFIENSRNLYLEVAVEQGMLGFLALVFILAASFLILAHRFWSAPADDLSPWRGGVAAGLLILILHGLVENTLYNNQDVLFLLVLSGLAVATTVKGEVRPVLQEKPERQPMLASKWGAAPGVLILGVLLLGAVGFHRPLLGKWYANLGAVQMAHIDLDGFPSGQWDDGRNVAYLEPAIEWFHRAVQHNPEERTANHRLGLTSALQRDFSSSVMYLEKAYERDKHYYGIRKALGYSYVWSGDLEPAVPLLAQVPEAGAEMGVYAWWWRAQGRDDLSASAKKMHDLLRGKMNLNVQDDT